MNGYEFLANAIVEQAVKDYKELLTAIKKNRNNRSARAQKIHIEKFFLSDWFSVLTDLDGRVLIKKLKEVYGS